MKLAKPPPLKRPHTSTSPAGEIEDINDGNEDETGEEKTIMAYIQVCFITIQLVL